jgi:hypothetical protein
LGRPTISFLLPLFLPIPAQPNLLSPFPGPASPRAPPLSFRSLTDGPHLSGPSSSPSQTQTRVRVGPALGADAHRADLEPALQNPRVRPINPPPCA